MRVGAIAIILIPLLTTACSKSSVQLLKAGDPKVCANSDVIAQVFNIIEQNANIPQNNGFIHDYPQLARQWQESVSFSADTITSESIDAANQHATCSANIHLNTRVNGRSESRFVEYNVSADLSSDSKVIVAADTASAQQGFSLLINDIAAPVIIAADEQKRADTEARNKAFQENYNRECNRYSC